MSTKCICGHPASCRTHSKIKMVVMLKPAYKTSFQKKDTVKYSCFKEERKPEATIIINMLRRLEGGFKNAYTCIIFYNNITDTKIHTHY